MKYQIKADKIFIENDKNALKARLYLAPKDESMLSGLGQLFIIVEAKSREKKIPQILKQIISELSEYYYHSPTKNTEAALETTAQYFNENIVDITGKNLKWIKDKISILIAAVQDDKLILTNYNSIKLWLFRDNKIHDVTAGQSQKKPTGKKILSQLINGKLNDSDVLLLTNNAIFDYFSDEKIKKTVTTLAPTQACAFFKNTLLDYKINVNFATIIIKLIKLKKTVEQDNLPNNILNQKETNQKELELINENWLVRIWGQVKKTLYQQGQILKDKLTKKTNKVVKKYSKTDEELSETKKQETPTKSKKDTRIELSLKQKIIEKIRKIKVAEYRLITLIVLIAILFTGSLLVINNKKKVDQQNEKFNNLSVQIGEKIDSIEAALIYKDRERAQELLSEAKQLLDQLKPEIKTEIAQQQNTYNKLENRLEAQINKIYKLESINNSQILAEFVIQPETNILLGPKNILYIAEEGKVYKVNSQRKTLDKVAELKQQIKKIVSWQKDKIILSGDNNLIWLMDINNYSLNKLNLKLPDDNSQLTDINSYSNKIYALDKTTNNIYKYRYNKGSFGEPDKWLQQNVNLDQGKEILVDGNVWITTRDGLIKKFFKGKQEIFSLKGLYEPLGKEIKLWTDENLTHLYIVDQEKNRIIITDKAGRVKRQLLGDNLESIRSVVPNDTESELYILTTHHIYKFKL